MVYRRVGIYVTKTSLVDQLPPARADIRTKKKRTPIKQSALFNTTRTREGSLKH